MSELIIVILITACICALWTFWRMRKAYEQGFEEGRAEGILDSLTGDWVEIEEGVWMKKTDEHVYWKPDNDD